jgi:serine/threonine protein kinase
MRFQRSQERFEMLLEGALGTNAVGPSCLDFLERCLQTAPDARLSVAELLEHPFVTYVSFRIAY